MSRPFISAYTPSNTDPAILEQIFVQRQKLLKQIVKKLERSMLTAEKHHILLVGARGCGKTHLLTLAAERLQNLAEENLTLKDNMRLAWLSEDDTFTELVDIAVAIADALQNSYPEEFNKDYRAAAKGAKNNDEAALAILNALLDDLPAPRSILLMTENLDRTFNQLSEMGQRTWRGFLQEKQRIATLASAQQLVDSLSNRDEPFYGFFNIEHLSPLSADQAFELIKKIANVQENEELLTYLENDNNARYRIRALHYLAGGNQRMYVILSELLTKNALDDLVSAFEALADELTPYFQERLRSLPPQQAKIVQYLCGITAAQSVKSIAEQTFIAETTCSKQLSELKNKRYVVSTRQGKQSFYEISEPLMRLCLDIKNQRGKPLRLITQFIRAWFSVEEINKYSQQQGHVRLRQYCESALKAEPIYVQPLIKDLNHLIEKSIDKNDFEKAMNYVQELKSADEVVASSSHAEIRFKQAVSGFMDGKTDISIKQLSEVVNLPNLSEFYLATTLLLRGYFYGEKGEFDLAILDYSALINLKSVFYDYIVAALLSRAFIYRGQSDLDLALRDYSAIIDMKEPPMDQLAKALLNRGLAYSASQQYVLAQKDYITALKVRDIEKIDKNLVLFAIIEPLLITSTQTEFEAALLRAFNEADANIEGYGGAPHDLLETLLQLGSIQWPSYVAIIVNAYNQYQQTEKLTNGLVQSIRGLAKANLSPQQLDAWFAAWQQHTQDMELFELPLQILAAAIESIKTKDKQPLLALPLEIRQLVLPLLGYTEDQ